MDETHGGLATFLLVVALAACTGEERGAARGAAGAGAPPEAEEGAACLQGGGFTAAGGLQVEGGGAGDAGAVRALRWNAHEGCERFVIDLADGGDEPAGAPGRVRAELLRELGVVRVSLLDVERVGPEATEAGFGGALAGAAYAVRSPEGRWVFVDLHLAGSAEARLLLLRDPARVVVDLRPGGAPLPPPPATGTRVVVLEPRAGDASYPVKVHGYARTFEANVVARLERAGEELLETFTTATAWVDAWGHFELTIPRGPAGEVMLHVGEYSAKDGSWEGVRIPLRMR
jgi:hypothetical protein